MNTQRKNEYSEIMDMFKTLTTKEAERVLEFMRSLRPISNDSENHA